MCADKKRRVRGTISNIHLKIKEKSTDPKEGNINFHDTINWENEMVVFQDSKPEELAKWKDEKFDFSSFDASLLYQLYKDKQLIVFEIEPENQSSPKIVSMEIVDE